MSDRTRCKVAFLVDGSFAQQDQTAKIEEQEVGFRWLLLIAGECSVAPPLLVAGRRHSLKATSSSGCQAGMVSGAFFGGCIGLAINMYSNALRKVPLMRQPWEHLIAIGGGAWAGKQLVEYENRTAKELEGMLAKRAERNQKLEGFNS